MALQGAASVDGEVDTEDGEVVTVEEAVGAIAMDGEDLWCCNTDDRFISGCSLYSLIVDYPATCAICILNQLLE